MYEYRAKLDRVIDGDTLVILVDLGFHMTAKIHARLVGVDTPELNSRNPDERVLARQAKDFVAAALGPGSVLSWPLLIRTSKSESSTFGRWPTQVLYAGLDGVEHDLSVDLLTAGLAQVSE